MMDGKKKTSRKRFVILDRDGTLIEECHYLSDPSQVKLLPGIADGLRQLRKMGLGLIVITNQSGIGRGFFDETRLTHIHQRMRALLQAEGVYLDGIYFCPHGPDDNCQCRKPRPGLLEKAAQTMNFDPQECFVIGDKASDIELGKRVNATTFLVRTGYGNLEVLKNRCDPDYIVDDLWEAAHVIRTKFKKSLANKDFLEYREKT
jgi:D-glycero-D-manno-heptose 1,7-bisphosphate phosphatase